MAGFESIEDLVAVVELKDIHVWEDSAKRLPPAPDAKQESGDEDFGFKLAVRLDDHSMGFRFRLTLEADRVEYVSDMEVIYDVPDDGPVLSATDRAIVQDFSERVAFMSVYPYVRSTVHASSGRLGASRPVLPIIKQGQVSGDGQELSPEEIQKTFGMQAQPKPKDS